MWPSASERQEGGQALILAIVIMLLLLFLGSIFLRTVLANLGRAEQGVAASNEYTAAEAGIRFADTNLTTGELGADWRPRSAYTPAAVDTRDPDYHWIRPFNNMGDTDPTNDLGGYTRYNLGDSRFLLRVTYNPNNDPAVPVMPDVTKNASGVWQVNKPTPLSKHIMIEVVGRHGTATEIDAEYQKSNPADRDPTVFTGDVMGSAGLRREMLAFKAIGINNYLRFVTDRDRLGRTTYFGVDQGFIRDGNLAAPEQVDYPFRLGVDAGAMTGTAGIAGWAYATGSPIRVNGNVVWYGSAPAATGGLPEITLNLMDPRERPYNRIEIAGTSSREGRYETAADPTRMGIRIYDPAQSDPGDAPLNSTSQRAIPTSAEDTRFDDTLDTSRTPALKVIDVFQDDKWLRAAPDKKQGVDPRRSVKRLPPPEIETADPGTGLLRYQAMTMGAPGITGTSAGDALSWQGRLAARYGFGSGIYIDNARHNGDHSNCRGDIQFNHSAESLRDEWMRPYAQLDTTGGKSGGWTDPGRVYKPAGVLITVEPDVIRPGGLPAPGCGLITVTRSDRSWHDPKGDHMDTYTMCYEVRPGGTGSGTREYTLLPKYLGTDPATGDNTWYTWNWTSRAWVAYTGDETTVGNGTPYPFNGVIYAEGNVRIRGRLPKDTAEGGVRLAVVSRGTIYIEGNLVRGERFDATSPYRSYIALLARDYVCLNTTQFVQVQADYDRASEAKIPPFFWRIANNRQDLDFEASWDFGMPPNDTALLDYYGAGSTAVPAQQVALFLRHQAARDPVTMQWLINNSPYKHLLTEHGYNSAAGGEQDFYPLFHKDDWELFRDAMTLLPFPMYPEPTGGASGTAWFDLYTLPGKRNHLRIQQYDPGQAPDGAATTGGDYNLGNVAIQPLDIFITALVYAEHNSWFVIPGTYFQDTSAEDPAPPAVSRYPRNGEPLDVQVTFLGAIAEGQAASLEDVTQWTAHWRGANRTDFEVNGSTLDVPRVSDPAATSDLTFSKRGGINYAFDSRLITDTRAVRATAGEPAYLLPSIPRLPVCPDLVYFGERPVQ